MPINREAGAGGGNYVTLRDGQWFSKSDNDSDYSMIGTIIKIEQRDWEWEGKPSKQCILHLLTKDFKTDTDKVYQLQFNLKSWYSIGFFSRAHKVDFTQEVELGTSSSEKSKATFCWIKQNGAAVKKDEKVEAVLKPISKVNEEGEKYMSYLKLLEYATRAIGSLKVASDLAPQRAEEPPPPKEEHPEPMPIPEHDPKNIDDDLPF